jgi:tRNA threonylcarbamoyladenosine biosynthesis protein TsaB
VNILALDTATELLSAALLSSEGTFYGEMDGPQRHSERLMELVAQLCAQARFDRRTLNLVACLAGPGSFTGLRIGFSAAKGIATALQIPLVAVPTLDCMALPLAMWPGIVVPLIDAKKNCYFSALYRRGTALTGAMDVEPQRLVELLPRNEPILITGPDAPIAASALEALVPELRLSVDGAYRRGYGRELIHLALARFQERGGERDSAGPEYLRKSDAELSRESWDERRGKGSCSS